MEINDVICRYEHPEMTWSIRSSQSLSKALREWDENGLLGEKRRTFPAQQTLLWETRPGEEELRRYQEVMSKALGLGEGWKGGSKEK